MEKINSFGVNLLPVSILSVILLCCANTSTPISSINNDYRKLLHDQKVNIYFENERDAIRNLEDFDRTNPECALWTNWQNACSRSGKDGSRICVSDGQRRVRASESFCVKTYSSGYALPMPIKQQISSLRFCKKTYTEGGVDYSGLRFEQTLCQLYDLNRPFNGRSLQARNHPACQSWKRGNSGVLACSQWIQGNCKFDDGVPRGNYPKDKLYIPYNFRPERYAIFGVHCN